MPEVSAPEGTVSNDVLSSVTIPAATTEDPARTAATSDAAVKSTASTDDTIPDEQLPQRLRGAKSLKDAVQKFKELESELGRKNNEVGQLRFVVDEMLQLKRTQDLGNESPKKAHTPVNTDSLLADPESAISSVVERTVGKATSDTENRLARMEYEAQKKDFVAAFPDYQATQESPAFLDWVKASPHRMRLAQSAANGSFEAAHDLFGIHKELAEAKAAATPKVDPKQQAAASLSRPGNGNTTGGAGKQRAPSASTAGKEIFSRVELGKLYANNREAYNAMGADIRQAYAEGRVR